MDHAAVLRAYDEQIRRRPVSDTADSRIEFDDHVVRRFSSTGWRGVTWSSLTEGNADAIIAEQILRFDDEWEWKYYSHDRPPDLPERLLAAGFVREQDESLLVAEIAELVGSLDVRPPDGIAIREVRDEADVAGMVAVHDAAFGGDNAARGAQLLRQIRAGADVGGFVAWAGSEPVGAGRIEFDPGDFASLWGGATKPGWRRRGVFRALVAHRAALAGARGYTYLQLDASSQSRPILVAAGFQQLAITIPFRYRAAG